MLTILIIPKFLATQSINTPKHFPDPNFRIIVARFMGVEPEGRFTSTDAAKMKGSIQCTYMKIKTLKGIEFCLFAI